VLNPGHEKHRKRTRPYNHRRGFLRAGGGSFEQQHTGTSRPNNEVHPILRRAKDRLTPYYLA